MSKGRNITGLLVLTSLVPLQASEIVEERDVVVDVELIHGGYAPYHSSPATEPFKIADGTGAKYSRRSSLNLSSASAFLVTPEAGPSVARSLRVWTADDEPGEDPSGVEIYGTDETFAGFFVGTGLLRLIAQSDALGLPLTRNAEETPLDGKSSVIFNFENDTAYETYVVVFTGTRDPQSERIQFAEAQLYTAAQAPAPELTALSLAEVGNESVLLTWTSAEGFLYQVYQSTDLGTWEEVEGASVTAGGAVTSLMIDRPTEGQVFFRIGLIGQE